ncbi:hypothetical protein B0H16DRAFT_1446905 [Mycena metata]|uniref:Uncharacterized protein n=1 Tax=Mycena metata TaxID=1033252 RepID=A0AAD7KFW3_9AGAR|nr:hypothetical protein B0H16DRAFT_1446905 [Mycena metata]
MPLRIFIHRPRRQMLPTSDDPMPIMVGIDKGCAPISVGRLCFVFRRRHLCRRNRLTQWHVYELGLFAARGLCSGIVSNTSTPFTAVEGKWRKKLGEETDHRLMTTCSAVLVMFWLWLWLFGLALASDNLKPGQGQIGDQFGFGFGLDESQAKPKPTRAKASQSQSQAKKPWLFGLRPKPEHH